MSLLTIKPTPIGSLTQREATEYLGGLAPLKKLEEEFGLVPWDENATSKRYRITSIEDAMKRAETETKNRRATRP